MQPSEPFSATARASFNEKPARRVFPLSLTAEWAILGLLFFVVYFAALFSPPLLDDADATHAQAAQHMVLSGDFVTLKVDGIRYLEKPPLPYWLVAGDYFLFGFNVFATHLPQTLAVLGCAVLAFLWGRRAYGERTAFYAALAFLTSIGVFLFTRWFIPESILTLLIALALYLFLTGLEDHRPSRIYWTYAMLALAMLAKGLIAPVFFLGAVVPYLLLTGEYRRWREFRLLSGTFLFLLIAAPWHILASLHNPDQGHPVGNIPTYGNVHGFLYFYFINEHVLRFLGKRYPRDYNKQPGYVFWFAHLIWLFPWSLYWPAALHRAWRNWRKPAHGGGRASFLARFHNRSFTGKTTLLLALYAGFILIFFSLSTNQEYYTYPAYFALLMLTASALAGMEEEFAMSTDKSPASVAQGDLRWLRGAHALFALVGAIAAIALGYGLWASRHLPFVADIGSLLAHRDVGGYSLSMSHFFDLTGPSFAALRLPAALAAIALLFGPLLAWLLRARKRHLGATLATALTAAVFLIAAHIAFARFAPMMSSRAIADTVNRLAGPNDVLMLYGDQSYGSSIIFYTQRRADLVNGRTTSMLWGSCYPDAPHIFLNDADLMARWGHGPRKFLFVPGKYRDRVETLLQGHYTQLQEISDKVLLTDRPLTK
ncbi:MAG TPA: glycosyltransferase family 39 protein [Acidobacteriaceae bacterium]|jgi:4-amino-4-deoxy-L-arabinose transferase-like glycosyltransferase|nr:glycosyltransferase family 39 protein [Acidobacteriaceae bacterium]